MAARQKKQEMKLVKAIRKWSFRTKSQKAEYADKAVRSIGLVRAPIKWWVARAEMVIATGSAGLRIVDEALSHEKIRPALETLVENIIGDVANRANEVANLVENGMKNPTIRQALSDIDDAGDRFEKACNDIFKEQEKVKKSVTKKTARRKPRV